MSLRRARPASSRGARRTSSSSCLIIDPILSTLAGDSMTSLGAWSTPSGMPSGGTMGGVDVIWIETMSHLSEIKAAIAGARRADPSVPIVATMTFDTRGHTMMGVSPEEAVTALAGWGADAIGGNCGNGPDELLPVIERMRAVAPHVPLVAKPNIGIPVFVGARAEYRTTPETMAGEATSLRAAGATVIGACCGSTAAHLEAMALALGVKRATNS